MRKRKSHIRGKVGEVFGAAGLMIRKYSRSSVRENSMSLYGVMMDMVQSWGLGLEQECGLGVPLGVDAGGGVGKKGYNPSVRAQSAKIVKQQNQGKSWRYMQGLPSETEFREEPQALISFDHTTLKGNTHVFLGRAPRWYFKCKNSSLIEANHWFLWRGKTIV